ncbi:MAG: 4'-phosphopantetheinyl transferase superfamily protein [Brumimicrobium sp.]
MLHTEIRKYGSVTVHLLYYDGFVMNDHLNKLLPHEWETLSKINHPNKKREFVAMRTLRTLIFGNEKILYNEIGAPYIENHGFISISHADCVVGLAFCEDFRVGLDLEPIREMVLRVKHKFLSQKEKESFDLNSTEEMIKIWSGKEALYKLSGRKKIIFAKQLLLTRIDELRWKGEMVFPDTHKEVEMVIEKIDNFVISINTQAIYESK